MEPVTVGAVLYDPKVSVIWDIIREFFEANGVPMDVKLYKDYDLQNQALMDGEIEIAWNSPLAWLDAQKLAGGTCRAIAMRDTDRDRVSHLGGRQRFGHRVHRRLERQNGCPGCKRFPASSFDTPRPVASSWTQAE